MKLSRLVIPALLVALLAFAWLAGPALAANLRNFTTSLKGANERPAPVETNAQGQAIFHLSDDGQSLEYKLITANIAGVTQAHVHCGSSEVAGPVVVFLYGLNPAGVDNNGVLAEGTLTPANLIPRPDSAACPGGVATWDDLLAKIESGEAYVNVHTLGFPAGEIRGQLD
jgi:hypothetical protein